MPEVNFELLNTDAFRKDLKKAQKQYKKELQRGVARFLDLVRYTAAEKAIRANTTGLINPHMARKRQRPHPTKLTHRTGKMRWMLLEDIERSGARWRGFGRKLAKLDTSALKLLVRAIEEGEMDEYLGTIRVYVSSIPARLSSRGTATQYDDQGHIKSKAYIPKSMPVETRRTLALRFMHELGLRGRRRPYMEPAAQMILKKLPKIINDRISKIWGGI